MSGTINLALTQQFDADGVPLSGGLLSFFTAGTTTPQPAYQDTALTIAHPNPIVLDASGRVPMFYVADGFIKIRLTDKNGVVVIAADQLLVIGPSSGGGGGGGGVDPTTLIATGDIKARYGENTLTGYVRCNGNTIGQTGSSANELAGPTAQALYEYLWGFGNITLQGATKGASATADFGALKKLILPDLRGRTIAGVDDMGATAANRLTSTYFGASAVGTSGLGAAGGVESHTLTTAQLASHSHAIGGDTGVNSRGHIHTGSTGVAGTGAADGGHEHGYLEWNPAAGLGSTPVTGNNGALAGATTNTVGGGAHTHNLLINGESQNHTHPLPANTSPTPSSAGTAHNNTQPTMVMTWYMKL